MKNPHRNKHTRTPHPPKPLQQCLGAAPTFRLLPQAPGSRATPELTQRCLLWRGARLLGSSQSPHSPPRSASTTHTAGAGGSSPGALGALPGGTRVESHAGEMGTRRATYLVGASLGRGIGKKKGEKENNKTSISVYLAGPLGSRTHRHGVASFEPTPGSSPCVAEGPSPGACSRASSARPHSSFSGELSGQLRAVPPRGAAAGTVTSVFFPSWAGWERAASPASSCSCLNLPLVPAQGWKTPASPEGTREGSPSQRPRRGHCQPRSRACCGCCGR